MAPKSMRNPGQAIAADLMLQGHDVWDPLAAGSWTPSVDICQTEQRVLVRAELPGVDASDIAIGFQDDSLRLQGIRRDPSPSAQLLCYLCLERRYGSFDRRIKIGGVVNPRRARAHLDKGILTIELPKLKDRRGDIVEIQIKKK
jgi:HSP20 family protein